MTEKPARVLIVENDLAIAQMIAINLQVNGFRPAVAVDRSTAQSEVDSQLPKVVLLSTTLGGDAAFWLADKWRASPRTRGVPIVLLAGHEDRCTPLVQMETLSYSSLRFISCPSVAGILRVPGRVLAWASIDKRQEVQYLKTLLLFLAAALAEIAGCYLPYLWLNKGASAWLLLPAAASLALFAWLLTLHPSAAGRVYAAYGGVYIAVALAWLWAIDGIRPTGWDVAGVVVSLAGMALIAFQPRGV